MHNKVHPAGPDLRNACTFRRDFNDRPIGWSRSLNHQENRQVYATVGTSTREPHVDTNRRDRKLLHTKRITDRLASRASYGRMRMITSLDNGGDEDIDSIDLVRIEKRPQDTPATFNQDIRHPAP